MSIDLLMWPTPVHDHLAWGLVGLYVGEQAEEVYEPARSEVTPFRSG